MEFYAPDGMKRPVRLSESTRRFAYESLHFAYGQDTRKTPGVAMDATPGFAALSPLAQYDAAIRRIAEEAPLRFADGELVCGAATLGIAIRHKIPATWQGQPVFWSISHLTIDFETVLKKGVKHIRKEAEAALIRYRGTEREPFVQSCLSCLDSFAIWHRRYLSVLAARPGWEAQAKNLSRVPWEPAESFYEAVQSIWFVFAFVRLCGNWPGIGRIDWLLGDYLKRDLASGLLSLDEAREILAHFFIKGCEWVSGGNYGSGDAQHYQNILLAGVDEEGNEVTNEVTYLVLDILEELGISDFPTTVRLNQKSDERLVRRVAEVMRYGGGILAVYNEELIIDSLCRYGYPLREARKFANDGCWEVQIPGKTYFTYVAFDALRLLQEKTLGSYAAGVDYPSFEALYESYVAALRGQVESIFRGLLPGFASGTPGGEWVWRERMPCTVVSLFEEGCIAKGLSYLEGGPVYNVIAPHIGGFADAVNSLYAIKRLVYDERVMSLSAFLEILSRDFEGEEPLRLALCHRYVYYGNDSDEVDGLAARLLSDFADACASLDGRCGYSFPAGVSTFGRQLEWAPNRLASPHGRKKGEVLAANCSPTPGTDTVGATAVIRSYCKLGLDRLPSGAALDIKLLPTAVRGEDGLLALCALLRGFVLLGGFFMQPDVADAAILRAAQENPAEYETLSVRVSGWNARFITLDRHWQDMVIGQVEGR